MHISLRAAALIALISSVGLASTVLASPGAPTREQTDPEARKAEHAATAERIQSADHASETTLDALRDTQIDRAEEAIARREAREEQAMLRARTNARVAATMRDPEAAGEIAEIAALKSRLESATTLEEVAAHSESLTDIVAPQN